jgi:hypothetical protein
VAGVAALTAPIIAGLLTTYLSWRISFAAEVVVVVVVVSLARKYLAESRPGGPRQAFDWGGVVLSALGFAITVFGVLQATAYGFWTARQDMVIGGVTLFTEGGISPVPVIVGIGLLVLVLFAAWERWARIRRGREPLVHLSVLRLVPLRVGVILMSALVLVQAGILFAVPVFTQIGLEYSAIQSGITLLPLTVLSWAAAFVAPKLRARGGYGGSHHKGWVPHGGDRLHCACGQPRGHCNEVEPGFWPHPHRLGAWPMPPGHHGLGAVVGSLRTGERG